MDVNKRLDICKKCPLYKETNDGPRCNNKKYINKDGLWSYLPKEGYVRGCNCLLEMKAANPNKHCIVGLW